ANVANELCTRCAELLLDRRFAADAADHLAAVASRCAPADTLGFEQDHGAAALGHRQCRRDAREATADNPHIRLHRTVERRIARLGVCGRGVVRAYVILICHDKPLLSAPSGETQIPRDILSP